MHTVNNIRKDEYKLTLTNIFSSKARAKILEVLALENELNISEIIKITSLNHSCVENHLEFFKNMNFVEEKRFGRIRIYRFKDENINAHGLKNLINLWSFK